MTVSGGDSGELTSRLGVLSFVVVCLDGANDGGTGVGDEGMTMEALEDLSAPCRTVGGSEGEGSDWMTSIRA